MRPVLFPPALRPGDPVRVVAPSGPFDPALVQRGIGCLAERYRVEAAAGLWTREGLFAGSDARRLEELGAALADPVARAVFVARGGHGLLRIIGRADLAVVRQHPKWVVGFSDVTALHLELGRLGVASVHGPNVTGIGRADDAARARLFELLETPGAPRRYDGLECWQGGRARGTLAGGNLTLLFSMAAAGRLRLPPGSVLLLEDVAEAPYRLDRMLTALGMSGALSEVSAVILGEFVDCAPGPPGVPAEDVLRERLSGLGVPVLAGLPVGHGERNEPLVLGLEAEVDAEAGSLCMGPVDIRQ